jgi:hypothetical protein
MPDTFNGYHVWLGIPASEQPPNHYRLLGIALFETDLDVIEHAADRQMAHVRTFQGGKHQTLSQQILNELSAARLCLLNAGKKASYDESLRDKLGTAQKAAPVLVAKPIPKAQPAAGAIPYATPVAAPVAAPVKAPARPAAVAARPAAVHVATATSVEDDLGAIESSPGLSVSGGNLRLRRRRFGSSNSTWQRPAMLGIAAAVVVTSFMLLYFAVGWLSKNNWRQYLDMSVFEPTAPATAPAAEAGEADAPPAAPLPATPEGEPALPSLKRTF